MRTLTRHDLEWIPHAPLTITRSRRIVAPPERVWEAIADHERWPEWFEALDRVERIGDGEGVGGGRRVTVRGMTVEEEFLAWEPGARFGFVVTHADRPGLKAMVEDVRLTAEGDVTRVDYSQGIDPVLAKVTAPLFRRLMAPSLEAALESLDRRLTG